MRLRVFFRKRNRHSLACYMLYCAKGSSPPHLILICLFEFIVHGIVLCKPEYGFNFHYNNGLSMKYNEVIIVAIIF